MTPIAGQGSVLNPSMGAGTSAPPVGGSTVPGGNAGTAVPQAGTTGGGGTVAPPTGGTTPPAGGMGGTVGAAGMGEGGTVATAGTGAAGMGEAGMGAAGSNSAPVRTGKPYCITQGSQGVFIGDSYVNYLNNQEPRVRALAIEDGALPSGQRYRDVAVAGTALNYGLGPIPTQWEGVKNSDVRFVVMDGGGNDVLINNSFCLNPGSHMDQRCQAVVAESVDTLKMMWTSMKSAGVRDVVMFYYPHTPVGGVDILDYAYPPIRSACESFNDANFTCHFIDTRPAFEGKMGVFSLDGIHPTASGADIIAGLIYDTMKAGCVGQPMSSGCCEAK